MRKIGIFLVALGFSIMLTTPVAAHQPVVLLDTDTSAERGPLLLDGTISFAIRASFGKAGQSKAFRAILKEGNRLSIQYLIVDKKPENRLKDSLLPKLVITSPSGVATTINFNERTKFFEPFGRTNYLYLARFNAPAENGIYNFVLTSRAKAAITIAVGDREVPGEVIRGPAPAPIPSATPTPTPTPSAKVAAEVAPTPSPTPVAANEVPGEKVYTMAMVRENATDTRCWSVINAKVYDLTKWINLHPGGASFIRGLCGRDGSSSFNNRHQGQSNPMENLANYLLGPLTQ